MSHKLFPSNLSRRDFLKLGGGALAAATGIYLAPKAVSAATRALQANAPAASAPISDGDTLKYSLVATDGWIYLPGEVAYEEGGPGYLFHPDPASPSGGDPLSGKPTTYAFGFRDVTHYTNTPGGLTAEQKLRGQANKVQASAPLLFADEGKKLQITLTNLGLIQRPDLTDGHTIHFHGFPNAIPVYDGVPELSVGVPIGDSFTYYYEPHNPGTYMYHCHFEDVEHVSMGMTGVIFIRPKQNGTSKTFNGKTFTKFVYNDGDGSTGFEREFGLILTEIWAEERWRDAHIQENDWSDYKPNFWAINGRVYPDTLAPNGLGIDDPGNPNAVAWQDHKYDGDLIPTPGLERLQYQPLSALVKCNAGEQVLLRLVNLGYQQQTMKVDGLTLRVVGKDARPMGNRAYNTDSVYIGPGDSYDVIFTAPAVSNLTKFKLYNANQARLNNPGVEGLGGQMTEIHVYPSATPLPAQTEPNA